MKQALLLTLVGFAAAQKVGNEQPEVHPKLSWKQCDLETGCEEVQGEVTIDSNWRWLHETDGYNNCFQYGEWNDWVCDSVQNCTENCALEGSDYPRTWGISTDGDSITMKYKTLHEFSDNRNSRVFLMDSEDSYQMFTLMDNEIAFDVDLSTVECGIKSSFYFVAMEKDGGSAQFPTNEAGAKYGTGYCDSSCPRGNKFNGGRANYDWWEPSPTDDQIGMGYEGACCAEFDVMNSNARSYAMSSKPCVDVEYIVCDANWCDGETAPEPIRSSNCDKYGCDYNPHRLGVTDFYGRGKEVDTNRTFTVVTRFEETGVTQFFIQDGKRIDVPAPAEPGFPDSAGLTEDYCDVLFYNFDERDRYVEVGGFPKHNEALRTPMVLTLAITDDDWSWNAWLDATWPPDNAGHPGTARGPCNWEDNDPLIVEQLWPRAQAVWSNIRFGPIGSTVDVDALD